MEEKTNKKEQLSSISISYKQYQTMPKQNESVISTTPFLLGGFNHLEHVLVTLGLIGLIFHFRSEHKTCLKHVETTNQIFSHMYVHNSSYGFS